MKKVLWVAIATLFLAAPLPALSKPAVQCPYKGLRNGQGLTEAQVQWLQSGVKNWIGFSDLMQAARPACIESVHRMERKGDETKIVFLYASTVYTDRLYRVTVRKGYVRGFETVYLSDADYTRK